MTSKFSRGASTQTKPPVCHVFPWPPVTFVPPDYPPLHGYCQHAIRLPDGTYSRGSHTIRASWHRVLHRWFWGIRTTEHWLTINVWPSTTGGSTRISHDIVIVNGPVWTAYYSAPPYHPRQFYDTHQLYDQRLPTIDRAYLHLHT